MSFRARALMFAICLIALVLAVCLVAPVLGDDLWTIGKANNSYDEFACDHGGR